jgi:hypothetical protein
MQRLLKQRLFGRKVLMVAVSLGRFTLATPQPYGIGICSTGRIGAAAPAATFQRELGRIGRSQ